MEAFRYAEDIAARLESWGWRIQHGTSDGTCGWYAWKKGGDALPLCPENKRPPIVVFTPYRAQRIGPVSIPSSWSVSITAAAEVGGPWVRIEVYGDLQPRELESVTQAALARTMLVAERAWLGVRQAPPAPADAEAGS